MRFAVGSWFVATFLAFLGTIRSAVPSVLPDPVRRFKIGRPRDYTPGLSKEFSDEGVIVVCDEEGLSTRSQSSVRIWVAWCGRLLKVFSAPAMGLVSPMTAKS